MRVPWRTPTPAPCVREEARRVVARPRRAPAGLDADHAHGRVLEEGVEEADRVRAAADAGDERGRAAARPPRGPAPRASRPITAWKSRTIIG